MSDRRHNIDFAWDVRYSNISNNAKLLWAEMHATERLFLDQKDPRSDIENNGTIASLEHYAEFLNVSVRTVQKLIKELLDAKFIAKGSRIFGTQVFYASLDTVGDIYNG